MWNVSSVTHVFINDALFDGFAATATTATTATMGHTFVINAILFIYFLICLKPYTVHVIITKYNTLLLQTIHPEWLNLALWYIMQI